MSPRLGSPRVMLALWHYQRPQCDAMMRSAQLIGLRSLACDSPLPCFALLCFALLCRLFPVRRQRTSGNAGSSSTSGLHAAVAYSSYSTVLSSATGVSRTVGQLAAVLRDRGTHSTTDIVHALLWSMWLSVPLISGVNSCGVLDSMMSFAASCDFACPFSICLSAVLLGML